MSTDRHPLDDAQAEAERTGADYEVPVALVRQRVRQRRRVRAAARGGVACAAVGVVVVALPLLLGGQGRGPVAPGDRPTDLDRCGRSVEVRDDGDTGPLTVTVDEPDGVIGADRQASTTTRVTVERGVVVEVTLAGVEMALVRDGVVVGVDTDAPVTVPLPEPPADALRPAVASWEFAAVVAPCAQHADGTGEARVPTGDYELVVTQTVGWSTPDGRQGTAVVSRTGPVTVTEEVADATVDPTGCLADSSTLAALATPEARPLPVSVGGDVPDAWDAGEEMPFTVTVTHEGTTDLRAQVDPPTVLLTRDGQVVGTPLVWGDTDVVGVSASPGASLTYEVSTPLLDCTTLGITYPGPQQAHQPLPPGQYEVWVVLDHHVLDPAAPDAAAARVVGGPWPLTVRDVDGA